MSDSTKRNILLVEDQESIRLSQAVQLAKEGYEVLSVPSGEDAIHAVNSDPSIGLILMDINLGPGLDGTETAELILKDHDVPIIFLSGSTEKEIVERTERITSYGYIVKGTNIKVLDASIKTAFKLHEAYQTIKTTNERLKLAQEASYAGTWDWDIIRNNIYWSPEFLRIFGMPDDTLAGFDSWIRVLHPEDRDDANRRIQEAMENGTDLINEYRIILPEGTIRWIRAFGKTYYENSKPVRMVGLCMDITETKQTTDSLKQSEEKFFKLFNASPEAITVASMNSGKYLEVNDAFLKKTGFTRDEIIGHTSMDINVWVDKTDRQRYIDELTLKGSLKGFDVSFRMKNSEIRLFSVSSEILNLDEGPCSLNHIIDITDQKRIEKELRLDEQRLESLVLVSEHQANTIQEFLDYALGQAIALTNSRIGYVYFYNDQTRQFTLNSWSKGVMEECKIQEPDTVYDLDKTGLWGEAVRQGQPIIVNDFHAPHPLKKGYPNGHAKLDRFLTLPIRDSEKIVAVVGVANKDADYDQSDIRQLSLLMSSVWKHVERRRAEEKYRRLFSEMPYYAALYKAVTDDMGNLVDYITIEVNDKISSISGPTKDRFLGRPMSTVLPPEELKTWLAIFSPVILTGRSVNYEIYVPSLSRHLRGSAYCPEPGYFAVIFSNITKQKKAEETIAHHNTELSDAVDLAGIAHWERDPETNDFILNDAHYALLKTTAEKQGGYRLSTREFAQRFLPPGELEAVQRAVWVSEPDKSPITVHQYEHRIIRADGEIRFILVRMRTVRNREGKTIKIFGTTQDITERKKAEDALHHLNRELQAVSECHKVLLRATDEHALLEDICRIVCEKAGYRMAW
jgi:PAS domain S-box-containing protein